MVMKGSGRTWVAALSLVVVAAVLPQRADAGDPIGRLSLALRVGVGSFDMGPVNDGISTSNQRLDAIAATADWDLPGEIHSGFNVGGDLNYDLTSSIRVGAVYGSMWGSSSVDFLQKISIEPRSGFLFPRAAVRLPFRPGDDFSLRVFAGPMILIGAETKITHENTSDAAHRMDTMTIKGSGTGFAGGIAGEYTLANRFSLTFEGGYQVAKASFDSGDWSITEMDDPLGDIDGDTIPNNRDPQEDSYLWGFMNEPYRVYTEHEPTARNTLDIDFSGFILQAGFRVYLF
jgi:hypothetical protein